MLLTGREKTKITIETPKGIPYTAQILRICRKEREVSCAVEKDGGDDPDITTGALICAKVSFPEETGEEALARVVIDGGFGVGRVTKPGLDQPVGNAAINHVPREMIERITGVSGTGLLWKPVSGDLCAGGRTSGRADI